MEIAPLELTGGRYDGSPVSYRQGEMADLVHGLIQQKARKYGTSSSRIHLLTYCTDWRYRLSPGVLALVGYYSSREDHCFASIAYFIPEGPEEGEFRFIFPPNKARMAGFGEATVRNRLVLRPQDLTRPQISDDTVRFKLAWPPWRGS